MKISAAIVTRNRSNDVRECLESLLKQEELPFEILVIDNASEDDTKEIVNGFLNPLIKYIYCKDIGVSYARNEALEHCKGDFLCYLDDDSTASIDWLLTIKECFKNNNVAGIQGFIGNYYPKHTSAVLIQFQRDMIEGESIEGNFVSSPTFCAAGNLSFDVSILNKYEIKFNTELNAGEEQDFCRRLMEKGEKIFFLRESVILHKWKKSSFLYLERRYRTGVSQAVQEKKIISSKSDRFTSKLSKKEILVRLLRFTSDMSLYVRLKLILLLFLSNIVKTIGYKLNR